MEGERVQGKRAESRGQRSGGTGQPEQPFNARGARDAKGMQERGRFKVKGLRLKVRKRVRRGGGSRERTALSTPAQGRWMGRERGRGEGPKGWAMVFPETWNLEPT